MGLLTITEKQELIRAERERRRLIRLQQVRMQSREIAATIRGRVMKKKDQEIHQIQVELTNAIRERTPQLLESQQSSRATNDLESTATDSTCVRKTRKKSLSALDCENAVKRGQVALKVHRAQKAEAQEKTERILRRQRAREAANEENRPSSSRRKRSNSY